MPEKNADLQFAVLGLGQFGMSVLKTLAQYDASVLACDRDPVHLHEAANYADHVVCAEVADESAMEKLGLGNFDVVIFAMGEDFEASLLATMKAKELGAKYVVVKALGRRQKKILESIGADLVVLPEHEMGEKIARRLIAPNILDVLEDTTHYSITQMRPMEKWIGKTVGEADIRKRHDMTVLAILRGQQTIMPVAAEQKIEKGDVLVVLGKPEG